MTVAAVRPADYQRASLLDLDTRVADAVPHRALAAARAHAVVAVLDLPAGEWSPEPLRELDPAPFALLVVDGLLMRDLQLADSTTAELLGPGDLVDIGQDPDALLPTTVRWTVSEGARVALLDDRLLAIVRAWPAIGTALLIRGMERATRLAAARAISQLPRVDQRLLAIFGHLAERWGRVSAAGLIVPLQLTHETLGRLTGARRPTVSIALKQLAGAGTLERRRDGSWILRHGVLSELGARSADPVVSPSDARAVGYVEQTAGRGAREDRPTAGELALLYARVEALREQHAARLRRCAATIDRSRAARDLASAGRDAVTSPVRPARQ